MNIHEAWRHNSTIHHRDGITMTLDPERRVTDVHLRMVLEVCVDHEATTYLPLIAQRLSIPAQNLYVEHDTWGMVWVAFERRLPRLSILEAARLSAFFHVSLEKGWLPGPAPMPTEHQGAHWQIAYEALKDETDHTRWELRQRTHSVRMKITQQPATQIGSMGEWGVRLETYQSLSLDPNWRPITDPSAIDLALIQANIPLLGWFTAAEDERQLKREIMQRAKML